MSMPLMFAPFWYDENAHIVHIENYTKNIVDGTYEVNTEKVYDTYEDCNHTTHYIYLRSKVRGKLDLAFHTMEEYEQFLEDLDSATNEYTSLKTLYVIPNNTLSTKAIAALVDFYPKRELTADGDLDGIVRRITVSIEEA